MPIAKLLSKFIFFIPNTPTQDLVLLAELSRYFYRFINDSKMIGTALSCTYLILNIYLRVILNA